MKINNDKPSYYAVTPAEVRYDKKLTPHAKLLYGEITALSNKHGYCFATNEYFASLYEVHKITISNWISSLARQGYIKVETSLKTGQRYMFIVNGGKRKHLGGVNENTKGGLMKTLSPTDKKPSNNVEVEPYNEEDPSPNTTYNNTFISFATDKKENLIQEVEVDSDGSPITKKPKKAPVGKRHFKLAAAYIKFRKFNYKSQEEYNKAIARYSAPAAKLLGYGYTGNEILACMKWCEKNYDEWSLETVANKISEYQTYNQKDDAKS